MASSKLRIAFTSLVFAAAALPSAAFANSLGPVDGLPFFGRPYPYGYVYHRPPAECYELRPVFLPDRGWMQELVWICGSKGAPLTAKY